MTGAEKSALRFRVASFIEAHPPQKIMEPLQTPRYSPYARHFLFGSPLSKGFVLAAIVLLVGTSGVALASQDALPGGILFPVKIHLENIQGKLTFGTEAKVAFQSSLVEKRITEINTLQKEGQLKDGAAAEAQIAFTKNTDDLNVSLSALSKDGKHEVLVAAVNKLRPTLEKVDTETAAMAEIAIAPPTATTMSLSKMAADTAPAEKQPEDDTTKTKDDTEKDTPDHEGKSLAFTIHTQKEKILAQAEKQDDTTNAFAVATDENATQNAAGLMRGAASLKKTQSVVLPENTSNDNATHSTFGILKGTLAPDAPCADDEKSCEDTTVYITQTIIISEKETGKEVTRIHPDKDGSYKVELPAGNYVAAIIKNESTIAVDEREVLIQNGNTTKLDFPMKEELEESDLLNTQEMKESKPLQETNSLLDFLH